MAKKTKKELEAENETLTTKMGELEEEIKTLKINIELMKSLVKAAQSKIPNYNLYPGRLGISPASRSRRIC